MKIDIQFRGLKRSAELVEHIERQVHAALSRFGSAIRIVEVRLGDVNGPRGGVDKYCQLTLRSPRLGTLSVRRGAEEALAAVDQATERMGRVVGSRLERRRHLHRRATAAPLLQPAM